ncbi:MAG TPA: AAA family ATPase [Candidatus Paceibacterota bacterium]|nr:AAA family ATPase [Candidatus Paceibacterota bacterium]HPT18311.1 AAA family ATPase [Candidatus Paceibacterota bacterium]
MSKIIIGLVGSLASGKETIKKYLVEKNNAKDCKFSSILRDVLNRLSVPISRENLQKVSTVLRENFGEDLLASAIATDASKLDADIVVIDGVRRFTDIEHLKDLPNFVLVKIDADPKLRYERMKLRNENVGDDKKTFEEFMKDHEAEADKQIPEVMKTAKYEIINNGSFEDLYKQLDELIAKLS